MAAMRLLYAESRFQKVGGAMYIMHIGHLNHILIQS